MTKTQLLTEIRAAEAVLVVASLQSDNDAAIMAESYQTERLRKEYRDIFHENPPTWSRADA